MTKKDLISEISAAELTERMRREWDSRVGQDYRFWMGDGAESDSSMWETGARDFRLLFPDETLRGKAALELGCGVGRVLRAASDYFTTVTGIDISSEAIERGTGLLADRKNVTFVLGNGRDLSDFDDQSFDVAFTFAALAHMPLVVIGAYLRELTRVVHVGGELRLQLYIGNEQETAAEDTLAIRVLSEERLCSVVRALGLAEITREELKLPFEVSDPDAGAFAYLLRFRRESPFLPDEETIQRLFLSPKESSEGAAWGGSPTEYLMNVSRAQSELDSGKLEAARRTLEFAVKNFKAAEPEVIEVLSRLQEQTIAALPSTPRDCFEANLAVLSRRFPEVAEKLRHRPLHDNLRFEGSAEGEPVMLWNGHPLDNPQKPGRAAEVWVERSLAGGRFEKLSHLAIFGFAGGFHLEKLFDQRKFSISVIEPNLDLLRGVCSCRDLRTVFERLANIFTSVDEFRSSFERELKHEQMELLVHPQSAITSRSALDEVKGAFWSERGLRELRPSIAVVGPIYGGTLPILDYTTRALSSLNQRVQRYDLSGFHSSYNLYKNFVRTQARIDLLQGHQVETLSQLILEGVTERPVDIVISMAQAPLSPRVLTELRSRGIITVMWFVEDCRRFTGWKHLSRFYDYMFVIQKGDVPTLVEQAGAGRAIYLPVGCDPEIHQPTKLTTEERQRWGSAVSFVGAGYHNRQQMFASLAGSDFKIWGTEWPTCEPFKTLVQEAGRRLTPAEYTKIFNSTAVNLNLHSSVERDGVDPNGDFVNPRTFELAAAGAFQLVDERSLLPELFQPGKEVITFTDRREMLEKIQFYLAHPKERLAAAAAGRARALRDHTYEQRIRQMLGYIYADRFEELRSRISQSPWAMTLDRAKGYPELHNKLERVHNRGEEPTLDALIRDIEDKKGNLTDTEKRLLFMHHIRSQISVIETKRNATKS